MPAKSRFYNADTAHFVKVLRKTGLCCEKISNRFSFDIFNVSGTLTEEEHEKTGNSG